MDNGQWSIVSGALLYCFAPLTIDEMFVTR